MSRLASLWFAFVVLASIHPLALAGPACARRHYQTDNCVQLCKSKWGFPGRMMGSNPWGVVMAKPSKSNGDIWDQALANACGKASIGSSDKSGPNVSGSISTGSSSPGSSNPGSDTPSDAPESSAPSFPSSTSSTSSSSVSSTSTTSTSSSTPSPEPTTSERKTATSTSTSASAQSTDGKSSASSSANSSSNSNDSSRGSNASASANSSSSSNGGQSSASSSSSSSSSSNGGNASANANASSNSSGGSSSASSSASASSNSGDQGRYLAAHNSFRARHGAGALTWSDQLAGKAQEWANNCKFEHSGGSLGPFGENLAAGTGDSYNIESAIKSWTDESKDYNPSNPNPSHFTQVVWKGSTQLGCAMAQCDGIFASSFGKAKFFVCEYSAQGNVIGQFAQNVQA
ncbi:hypothetical protein HGRIS_007706 [Hohenbuehelia grisea]|uniref:SCP domain-containing protein n=1 Tax=Hohenbuehelia grisea TaxID=104357 RepID=A0ABR3J5Q0_9AGAR